MTEAGRRSRGGFAGGMSDSASGARSVAEDRSTGERGQGVTAAISSVASLSPASG